MNSIYSSFMQYASIAMERQADFLSLYKQLLEKGKEITQKSTIELSDAHTLQYFKALYDEMLAVCNFWGEIVTKKLNPLFAEIITSSPDRTSLEYQEILHVMGANDYFSDGFVSGQNYHGEIEKIFREVERHVFTLLDFPST